MSRVARVIVPGMPHHFTQRGNAGARTFFTTGDCQQYLIWLGHYARRYGLRIWAYCLMPNHVHLVGVPEHPRAPEGVFRALQMRHAQRINEREGRVGHLWQSRYFSTVLDETHLCAAVRYVERNPVRAGLKARAEDFVWSSAQPHCDLRDDPLLSDDLPLLSVVSDWRGWLSDPEDEQTLMRLRLNAHKGLPSGDDAFLRRIEGLVGRSLEPKPRGRPRGK
ncbi:MAG: transposase [Armatimonadetes bacterium]|nr:transposase [Armatimonadota bacterium]